MRDIFDFHIHPVMEPYQNLITHYYPGLTMAEMVKRMKDAGITKCCGSVITRNVKNFDEIKKLNASALEAANAYPDFYIPGVSVWPGDVNGSCEALRAFADAGVKLVGELVPHTLGTRTYAFDALIEILRYAGELDMIVSIHSMDDHDDLDRLAEALKGVTLVFAHPGEQERYMRHLERMRKYENVYLDLSGTGLFRYGMLKYGVQKVGADRILFGTDFPVCSPTMQIAGVDYEEISDRDRELILNGNAERLFAEVLKK